MTAARRDCSDLMASRVKRRRQGLNTYYRPRIEVYGTLRGYMVCRMITNVKVLTIVKVSNIVKVGKGWSRESCLGSRVVADEFTARGCLPWAGGAMGGRRHGREAP
eukprot:261811-Pyramimonas_sp.AAC.1